MRRLLPLMLGPLLLVPIGCGGGNELAVEQMTIDQPAAAGTTLPATPSAPASSRPARPPQRDLPAITLAFGGDVHFEGVDATRLARDPATALAPVAGLLSSADLAMVNLETAVTTRGTPAAKSFTFRAPASAFTALRAAGVDVATMANNHGMDYGLVGLQDSLAAAKAAGFPVVGVGADEAAAYRPYVATVRGVRVGVIGATQVLDDNLIDAWTAGPGKPGMASAKRLDRLVQAVQATRPTVDVLVVDLHYGTEAVACPTHAQRSLARTLVAAGVDVVVGSHAHALLGSGWLGQSYVNYGLGNFVFYSSGHGPSTQSGVLTLTVRGRHVQSAQWSPAHIEGGVARPLSGASAAAAVDRWNDLRTCTGLSGGPAGSRAISAARPSASSRSTGLTVSLLRT